jgi:hypothetical protein
MPYISSTFLLSSARLRRYWANSPSTSLNRGVVAGVVIVVSLTTIIIGGPVMLELIWMYSVKG